LNFVYVHLNRIIKKYNIDMIYICGPGHGGPGMVANTDLEGTYSEVYPNIAQDAEGIQKLFKQFSFPGGIPSHADPETPGSIHKLLALTPGPLCGDGLETGAHQVTRSMDAEL